MGISGGDLIRLLVKNVCLLPHTPPPHFGLNPTPLQSYPLPTCPSQHRLPNGGLSSTTLGPEELYV